MAKASFTVEAVFVVSICIWVLVALCYGGLYVHDRAVMASDVNSIVNRELIQRMNEDEGKSRKEINQHLYLLKIRQITKKKYLAWYKVTAEYEVPVSFPLLKKIWLGNKQTGIYETEKEQVEYARIKWDGEDG